MNRRKCIVALLTLCMMLVFVGCGASSARDQAFESITMSNSAAKGESSNVFYDNKVVVEEEYAPESEMDTGDSMEAAKEDLAALQERKLIKTVDMNVETKEFDQMLVTLEDKIAELGGYIESLDTYNGSSYSGYRSSRDANMTIRIPKQRLDIFLETVEGISNVVRRSESVEDVTLTYVDLESHKKVLLAEQESLLELLEKAEAIEDIITIKSHLSNVRYQIESMESQLRTFDNKVDYSTVYLNIEEVQELTPVEEETVLERIVGGFVDNLRDIKDGAVEFFIWFVINIPNFIVWIIIIVIVVIAIRLLSKVLNRSGKRGSKNRLQKQPTNVQASNASSVTDNQEESK